MRKSWFAYVAWFSTMILAPQSSFALGIFGTGTLGSFTGDISYSASSATSATLIIELTNTSPLANGGFITAFAFNNPNDQITGVTLSATDTDFGLLGATPFQDGISAPPLGSNFDIGASISSSWLTVVGPPNPGIGVGDTETFTFTLTGTGLLGLTEQSFVNELTSAGEFIGVRFLGFEDDGSDSVGGAVIPEPSTVFLLGAGLLVMAFGTRLRLRKQNNS